MREIKFRAWNTINKRYYRAVLIDNYLEVEQYTGLKDKNGVDIYENDIVKTLGANIYVVEFFDGKFNPVSDLEASDWEVIGNIHDNPDLLDGTDHISPDDIGNGIHEFLHGGDK